MPERTTIRKASLLDTASNDIDPVDGSVSPERVAEAIASGDCDQDSAFDRFLRDDLRDASRRHWTPVSVALRVASWLDEAGVSTVVDIGSGVGKFCVVAALASRCSFVGIEQRPRLVAAADALAHLFGVEGRVQFMVGAVGRGAIPRAEAYYLFNPFGENLFDPDEYLGDDVALGLGRYRHDVVVMESFFEDAPPRTVVIKYNGFGGEMPGSYDLILTDKSMPCLLRMWRKRA